MEFIIVKSLLFRSLNIKSWFITPGIYIIMYFTSSIFKKKKRHVLWKMKEMSISYEMQLIHCSSNNAGKRREEKRKREEKRGRKRGKVFKLVLILGIDKKNQNLPHVLFFLFHSTLFHIFLFNTEI